MLEAGAESAVSEPFGIALRDAAGDEDRVCPQCQSQVTCDLAKDLVEQFDRLGCPWIVLGLRAENLSSRELRALIVMDSVQCPIQILDTLTGHDPLAGHPIEAFPQLRKDVELHLGLCREAANGRVS